MKAHFVTFYSPGTLFAESTEKPIDSWDVKKAMKMASSINERYNATPYGFRFTTRARKDDELDSKVVATSPMYFLGGKVETLAQVKAHATDKDRILITNNNSWRWTQPLRDTDIVLDWKP